MRILKIAVPVAAAALLLAGCSSTANDTSGEEVSLITEGTLTVCTNPPYEPFEFEEDGEVVGLDMDIVNEVAKDLDADLEIKVTPFEGIQSGADLNSGNCDIVASGITITEDREENMDFSEPYFDADQGLLAPAGSGLASVEDLAGLTVGIQQATTGATFAEDEGLTVAEFEDLGLQIEALRSGQIDAVINDIAVLGPFASDDFEVGTTFPTGEQYGLGVKTGNGALLTSVNDTLTRIMSDGTYDDIYIAYIGTEPTDD
jgi:polar amino acid transport system substrate-binding protein